MYFFHKTTVTIFVPIILSIICACALSSIYFLEQHLFWLLHEVNNKSNNVETNNLWA